MNGFIRGALGLALAATAGLAAAQPHDPPLAGGPPERGMVLAQGPMHDPRFRDDMPGPDRQAGPQARADNRDADPMPPQGRYDAYGFDRMGLTADGYDRHGYDAHGYDRYGFDPNGFNGDGYDRYGYDERGLDRYGRRAPAAPRADAGQDVRVYSERRDEDRRGPPPGYDPQAYGRGQSEGYGASYDHEFYRERGYGDDCGYGDDRYGPVRDDRDAYDSEVPSYGGAMQHFADPRCNTCRPAPVRYDCGCRGEGYGYETSSVSVSPGFFYDAGGVGPIPDGGFYGGGGYVISGGGASASSSAYASSSSRVSVSVRGGGRGHHGGGHGGCNSCGGHK
jgi:hypothetical protein